MKAWHQTVARAAARDIFKREIDSFLPRRILDFHVHIFSSASRPDRSTPFSCAGHPLRSYTVDDFFDDCKAAYPRRQVSAVCFGMPFTAWNKRINDRYVLRACDFQRAFPVRLLDPEHDTPDEVRRDVIGHGYVGLKPYPDYVRKISPNVTRVPNMLPDSIMEIADDLGMFVVVHLPRPGRLADTVNRKDIARLCRRWTRAQIILAHVGRAYFLKNIVEGLDGLTEIPNLWFDTAMLNHWEVLAFLFKRADPRRLLFGSDAPIAFAPGKSVEINNQYTYITPAAWDLSIHDTSGKLVFTSFLYEELRAIRRAVEETGQSSSFVERLFFHNGMELLQRHCSRMRGEKNK